MNNLLWPPYFTKTEIGTEAETDFLRFPETEPETNFTIFQKPKPKQVVSKMQTRNGNRLVEKIKTAVCQESAIIKS